MIASRVGLARERSRLLADVPELTLPVEPEDCEHTFYLYTLMVPEAWAGDKRNLLVEILRDKYGVGSAIANPPTYEASPYIRKQTEGQVLPGSELLGRRVFCVPMHPCMTDEQNAYVAAAVQSVVEEVRPV
jgi:perosamine synthetase